MAMITAIPNFKDRFAFIDNSLGFTSKTTLGISAILSMRGKVEVGGQAGSPRLVVQHQRDVGNRFADGGDPGQKTVIIQPVIERRGQHHMLCTRVLCGPRQVDRFMKVRGGHACNHRELSTGRSDRCFHDQLMLGFGEMEQLAGAGRGDDEAAPGAKSSVDHPADVVLEGTQVEAEVVVEVDHSQRRRAPYFLPCGLKIHVFLPTRHGQALAGPMLVITYSITTSS